MLDVGTQGALVESEAIGEANVDLPKYIISSCAGDKRKMVSS
jgi:hypothetical protein